MSIYMCMYMYTHRGLDSRPTWQQIDFEGKVCPVAPTLNPVQIKLVPVPCTELSVGGKNMKASTQEVICKGK